MNLMQVSLVFWQINYINWLIKKRPVKIKRFTTARFSLEVNMGDLSATGVVITSLFPRN